jgi:hypothetical protein
MTTFANTLETLVDILDADTDAAHPLHFPTIHIDWVEVGENGDIVETPLGNLRFQRTFINRSGDFSVRITAENGDAVHNEIALVRFGKIVGCQLGKRDWEIYISHVPLEERLKMMEGLTLRIRFYSGFEVHFEP